MMFVSKLKILNKIHFPNIPLSGKFGHHPAGQRRGQPGGKASPRAQCNLPRPQSGPVHRTPCSRKGHPPVWPAGKRENNAGISRKKL
jgi:hypothetical protein